MLQHSRRQPSRAKLLLLVLSCAAAVLQAAAQRPVASIGGRDLAAQSRKLQTVLAVAKDQQDKWRAITNTLLGAIVSAFTKETLDAAGQVANMLLAPQASATSGAAQQPTAQIVQLPPNGPQSGINLKTDTPVDVGQPVSVDTPVKQTNVQWGGR